MQALTPELLCYAYRNGIFPMANPEEGNAIYFYKPDPRAILPFDRFHVSKTLGRTVRQARFEVVCDRDFKGVMRACADRSTTWISEQIIEVYTALHTLGLAHSVECWQEGVLVGGLYGVAIGGAFFGESMFHRERDASKVALVHLVDRLRAGGYVLHDIQYMTPHLLRFGAIEIPALEYERRLVKALEVEAIWHCEGSNE